MNKAALRGKVGWKKSENKGNGRKTFFFLNNGGDVAFPCVAWDELSNEIENLPDGAEIDIIGVLRPFKVNDKTQMEFVVKQVQKLDKEFSFDF